jgi:hypothetical protein
MARMCTPSPKLTDCGVRLVDMKEFPKEGVMRKTTLTMALIAASVSTGVLAADMLPLKQGIYVPANRPCKGASNAEIVNYWGGDASFGSAQATCKISKMARKGNVFTITDKCADIRGGGEIVGGPTVVTITSPTSFTREGETYRYCGTKVQL